MRLYLPNHRKSVCIFWALPQTFASDFIFPTRCIRLAPTQVFDHLRADERSTHILHLALAIRNRGYTNKVRLRGLIQNQVFQPAQAGKASCSRDFQSPGARYQSTLFDNEN
ncbi:MAG: hypothetical protein ACYTXY_31925 [Nostoc sp.]